MRYTIGMHSLLKETLVHWKTHNAPRMGAALSYYAMLSFIPLLVLLITVVGSLFSTEVVRATIASELTQTIGKSAAAYIDTLLRSIDQAQLGVGAAIASGTITIIAAIGIFSELYKDFDELWEVPSTTKTPKPWYTVLKMFIRQKIAALSFIPILVVLLFAFIMVSLLLSSIETHSTFLPIFATVAHLLQFFVPLMLGTVLFALMYRILPGRTLPWNIVFLGALITTLLFIVGNIGIVLYIQTFLHVSIFGAAASLVGLLVWVYYSSQIFFVGASFTYVYARRMGFITAREKDQS